MIQWSNDPPQHRRPPQVGTRSRHAPASPLAALLPRRVFNTPFYNGVYFTAAKSLRPEQGRPAAALNSRLLPSSSRLLRPHYSQAPHPPPDPSAVKPAGPGSSLQHCDPSAVEVPIRRARGPGETLACGSLNSCCGRATITHATCLPAETGTDLSHNPAEMPSGQPYHQPPPPA